MTRVSLADPALAAACKPKARLIAENLCLRQQLVEVCARTVAKYMRKPWDGRPSPGWRQFLAQHAEEIWASDLFTVQTIWFRTLYVFFIIDHGTREIIYARVTVHPTARWLAQQVVEACELRP